MGNTHSESGVSKERNRTNVSVIVYCLLSALTAYAIGGALSDKQASNRTLKMCNEKVLECKLKYDILMYSETGRVPYKEEKKK